MKTRCVIFALTFIFCISVCLISSRFVKSVMGNVIEYAHSSENAIEKIDHEYAKELIEKMKNLMDTNHNFLESLVPHEDLHDLNTQIEDAYVSLLIRDMDDFEKAIAFLRENADHLIDHESLLIGNIF